MTAADHGLNFMVSNVYKLKRPTAPAANNASTARGSTSATMTRTLVYNIPIELFESYRGKRVIVRASDPRVITENLNEEDTKNLQYVQILTLSADITPLSTWQTGVPIDLVMYEPQAEFGRLYNHAKLLDRHPMRVSIPVRPGFANAVKLASSLQFAVKLIVGQPTRDDLKEMFAALHMFLHGPTVTQPLEFYHGVLRSFFSSEQTTVWESQEEDPASFRYITRDGREIVSPRFIDIEPPHGYALDTLVDGFAKKLVVEKRECAKCEFLDQCKGYFKWPNKDYICAGGVRGLFHELKKAAAELDVDLETYSESRARTAS